jgi:uncharacterized membrane protein
VANREARRKAEVSRRRTADAQRQQPRPSEEPQTALEVLHQQQLWSGPIPSPADLQHYEAVHAGLAERIVAMAERQIDLVQTQQEHRVELEDMHVRGLNRRADVGLWMAFLLALVVLLGGMFLVYEDHDTAGTAIITIDLVGLVGVFIYGRRDQVRQERQPKQQ